MDRQTSQAIAYTHIFFDLDHTLWDFDTNSIDTLRAIYTQFALPQKGISDFDDFNKVYHRINDKLWDRFRKGYLSRQELRWKRMWQTLVHYRIPDEALAKQMSEAYLDILPTQTALFPHTHEVLQYLHSKSYSMHLITNGFELTQKQKLKNAALDTYFDRVITSEQAMSMKPHKQIFDYAMQHTGAKAAHSIMIGDAWDVDIVGAAQAGMHQVYFNPHKSPAPGQASFEIHSLQQLKDIL